MPNHKIQNYSQPKSQPTLPRTGEGYIATVVPIVGGEGGKVGKEGRAASVTIEYDIDELCSMPATDQGGTSDVLPPCRVPPNISRIMQIIMEAENSPFKTRSDLIRAMIFSFINQNHHGLKLKQTPEYKALMRLCAINRRKAAISRMQVEMDTCYDWINQCLSKRHTKEARKTVLELLEAVGDLEDGEWKVGILEHVKGTWGHLIQGCVGGGSGEMVGMEYNDSSEDADSEE